MGSSLNKVMLIGNLGSDPEVRNTPNGATVANFRVALTESWKDQAGNRQERTEWVTIVAWRQQAELAQRYLRKGSKVYIEGKLQTRQWEDKNGGGKRYATEVLCDHFMMLDGKPEGGRSERREAPADFAQHAPGDAQGGDDDLPF